MKILIAAATSNSGKTTFTMGLLRALHNRGLKVQPYKCGPDYIDTMFHRMASGNDSVNLDTFMASKDRVKQDFHRYAEGSDCQIVEGVMGLFDGYDKYKGSSAEIAMLLDIPVVLVVNAKSVAYSVAPLIYGFRNFNPNVRIAGVVFNMVASENHYSFLKAACEDAGVDCLGYLPRNEKLTVPGRHLGLTIKAKEDAEQLIALAASEIEQHVNLEKLISISPEPTNTPPEPPFPNSEPTVSGSSPAGLTPPTIAIATDEAFNFTYRTNIDLLRKRGNVVFFSPLRDSELPQCDFLYLPGGYPELFKEELSANASMRESIRRFAENNGQVFAECGGFMYLCNDIDGTPMCGVLPISATMADARLHLGYRQLSPGNEIELPGIGIKATRGHEFHYSEVIENPDITAASCLLSDITAVRCQLSAKGTAIPTALYRYKNVMAGYTHWYFSI